MDGSEQDQAGNWITPKNEKPKPRKPEDTHRLDTGAEAGKDHSPSPRSSSATTRRITALITVICLALLIFCLIEREVRRNLAPDTEIRGFYINDRRPRRPTARLILHALDDLRLIPAPQGQAATIPKPGYLQTQLVGLLRVDPAQPRWP